jgi:hypothetical protein
MLGILDLETQEEAYRLDRSPVVDIVAEKQIAAHRRQAVQGK